MKLAEALMERKAIKTKMEELKKRLYQNARVQEGEQPIEDPPTLMDALRVETKKFEELVIRINHTNNVTRLSDNLTLMEAIVQKDMLHYLHLIHKNLADKATPSPDRFSRREIKFIPAIDIGQTRQTADEIAQEYRLLDKQIQAANWNTELM